MLVLIILSFATGFIVSYSWRGLKMGKLPLDDTDEHHRITATYWKSNVLNNGHPTIYFSSLFC